MSKEDFDRYTKGPESPAKSANRFAHGSKKLGGDKSLERRYEADSLIPKNYDEVTLLKKEKEMMLIM